MVTLSPNGYTVVSTFIPNPPVAQTLPSLTNTASYLRLPSDRVSSGFFNWGGTNNLPSAYPSFPSPPSLSNLALAGLAFTPPPSMEQIIKNVLNRPAQPTTSTPTVNFDKKTLDQLAIALTPTSTGENFNGATKINPNSLDALRQLAVMMDSQAEIYGVPKAGSYLNEVNENDNYLSKEESLPFSKAIADIFAATSPALTATETKAATANLSGALNIKENGYAQFKESSRDDLRKVALMMDAAPKTYGIPTAGSWTNLFSDSLNHENWLRPVDTIKIGQGISAYINKINTPKPPTITELPQIYTQSPFNQAVSEQMEHNMLRSLFTSLFNFLFLRRT